jgi:hypothetical protein
MNHTKDTLPYDRKDAAVLFEKGTAAMEKEQLLVTNSHSFCGSTMHNAR